ncbi:unnamed protein product, partial [Mesorhabditis belari]|uniref:Uncharacterized protein n=1 Tax=Mesorhabditis belari TaxID=2138241 RepID=A0AAF3EIW3_9BILA
MVEYHRGNPLDSTWMLVEQMLVVVSCRASLSISARSKSARIVLADGLGAPFLEEYDEGSQSIDELIKVWGNTTKKTGEALR